MVSNAVIRISMSVKRVYKDVFIPVGLVFNVFISYDTHMLLQTVYTE